MVRKVGSRQVPVNIDQHDGQRKVEDNRAVEGVSNAGFVVREQLGALISARGKPPSMKNARANPANEAVAGELSPEGLALLGDIRSDILAYFISELSATLGKLDTSELTNAHLRGIDSVNQLTRMLEHLHIMRTNQVNL